MAGFPALLLRGLTILALGSTLALTHIAFAAAQPQPTQVSTEEHEDEVDTTSSIRPAPEPAENCYIDVQLVRGVRGKSVLLRVRECD
jgi:hypothetical protein